MSPSAANAWKKDLSRRPAALTKLPSCGAVVKEYAFDASRGVIPGTRLLFVSDLHVRTTKHFLFMSGRGLASQDETSPETMVKILSEALEATRPHILVIGGDVLGEFAQRDKFFSLLSTLPKCPGGKFAIAGNWDRRNYLSVGALAEDYESASFRLLVNERAESRGINFYALDDFKKGTPSFDAKFGEDAFNCILSHNPDAVPASVPEDELRKCSLVLCGHTHGGQARLPLFGAVLTSSRHWKRFEYGALANAKTDTSMIVSSGLGVTGLPFRFRCNPEALLITFTSGGKETPRDD